MDGMIIDGILTGTLTLEPGFVGSIKIDPNYNYDVYDGPYTITPKPYLSQTLATSNKLVSENIKVLEIPYYEVSNTHNGTTIIIGGN